MISISIPTQNQHRRSRQLLLVPGSLLLLCICLLPEQGRGQAKPQPAEQTSGWVGGLSPFAVEDYLLGLQMESEQNTHAASVYYERAWRVHPDSYQLGLSFARMLIARRNLDSAILVLNLLPDTSAERSFTLATCYRARNDDYMVLKYLSEAAQHDPDNPQVYSMLTNLYRKANHLDSALWAFSQLTRLQPDNAAAWNEIALLAARTNDTILARKALRTSVQINKTIANMHAVMQLAQSYAETGESDSALHYFSHAATLDSSNTIALEGVIEAWSRKDSSANAIAAAEQLVRVTGADRVAKRRLGIVFLGADSLRQADSIFSALVADGDHVPVTYFYLARVNILQHEYDSALFYAEQLVLMADTVSQAWLDLGFIHREMGNTEAEIKTYQRALSRIRSERAGLQITFSLGAAQERAGRLEEAIDTFERILANQPAHAPTLNYLGYTLADRKLRLPYAKDLIARALAIDSTNSAYLDSYGWVLFRLQEYDSALTYLHRAAEQTADGTIFDHIGDVYAALGQLERARTWWQKALELFPESEPIRRKLTP